MLQVHCIIILHPFMHGKIWGKTRWCRIFFVLCILMNRLLAMRNMLLGKWGMGLLWCPSEWWHRMHFAFFHAVFFFFIHWMELILVNGWNRKAEGMRTDVCTTQNIMRFFPTPLFYSLLFLLFMALCLKNGCTANLLSMFQIFYLWKWSDEYEYYGIRTETIPFDSTQMEILFKILRKKPQFLSSLLNTNDFSFAALHITNLQERTHFEKVPPFVYVYVCRITLRGEL